MIVELSFFCYFLFLMLFSLISHPVYYCILLVLNSMICSFISYTIYGFSWYPLLFCLVYIGGVYILFIFVSVHTPNSHAFYYWNISSVSLTFIGFIVLLSGFSFYNISTFPDYSEFLNTSCEGVFYVCMCLTLLFGFFVLSIVMSVKLNHYR